MTAIWYAISIYMIGIAVVLYLRPKTMFRDDGVWKEFGLQKDGTVFPFWMFAVVWAILAYALASLISMMFASIVLQSSENASNLVSNGPSQPAAASFMQPISQAPTINMPSFASPTSLVSQTAQVAQATTEIPKVPGYYILDPYSSGAPRYIYYGTAPPSG